ncbi:M23 family metallopeptidase [Candidatus Pelagibacter communis]|uniref:M23 family metallopeptidase n=1 Tax=Pelagibacter ubique TaxID=198252 RepID=UPI00094DDE37|nr:peptidoglycan DD-metalloendopeptidase family protein [Candidatus Pelagibacter ubique]
MKQHFRYVQDFLRKNQELSFVILLVITSVILTQLFQASKSQSTKEYLKVINNLYFQKTFKNVLEGFEPKYLKVEHKIANNESINNILKNYGVPKKEINNILNSLLENKVANNIKVNDIVNLIIDNSNMTISKLGITISKTKKIELIRDYEKDIFKKKEIVTNLQKKIIFKEGRITQSLYRSASKQNIPANIIVEFARIYGFQIDFQRDIRKNDSFQIIYEVYEDENKKIFNTGKIIFADLNLRNQSNTLYYFDKKGNEGHYDLNGKSAKKALMKTPINGARLSSPYGMRKHPIDGFNKMHRGTDFAAPEGTPIMASGDGVVIKASWCGGGGNCVKIKHNSSYSTVYAHMSKFSRLAKTGNRVKQGQIIGYVGSTGKSTGPHLHYEVIFNGKKINSQTLKLPSGKTLKGKSREQFEIRKIKTDVLKSELILKLS